MDHSVSQPREHCDELERRRSHSNQETQSEQQQTRSDLLESTAANIIGRNFFVGDSLRTFRKLRLTMVDLHKYTLTAPPKNGDDRQSLPEETAPIDNRSELRTSELTNSSRSSNSNGDSQSDQSEDVRSSQLSGWRIEGRRLSLDSSLMPSSQMADVPEFDKDRAWPDTPMPGTAADLEYKRQCQSK